SPQQRDLYGGGAGRGRHSPSFGLFSRQKEVDPVRALDSRVWIVAVRHYAFTFGIKQRRVFRRCAALWRLEDPRLGRSALSAAVCVYPARTCRDAEFDNMRDPP